MFFFLLSGCEKRKLIEPTSGMDSPERFWIRVLLFDNIKKCSLETESGLNAVDSKTQSKTRLGWKAQTIKVQLQSGKLVIAQKILGDERPFVLTSLDAG